MPVSKKRKKAQPFRKAGHPAATRRTSRNEWGSSKLDRLFEVWVDRLEDVPGLSTAERLLAAAAYSWVGATDPSGVGLNQCVSAAQWISTAMARVGYEAQVRAVVVTLLEGGVPVETLGSHEPQHADTAWTGHVVVHLPDEGVVFDATIGQARSATTQERMFPAMMKQDVLKGVIAEGSVVGLNRPDGLTLMYEFLSADVDFRTPSVYAANQRLVDAFFDEQGTTFIELADVLRALSTQA